MSGLLLTMVCLILSAVVLTMGPLPVESKLTGFEIELQMKKRSCSAEDGKLASRKCGRDMQCRRLVDWKIARNCGVKKRSNGQSDQSSNVLSELADRGRYNLNKANRRNPFGRTLGATVIRQK